MSPGIPAIYNGQGAMAHRTGTWGERVLVGLFGSEVRARIVAWLCTHGREPIIGRQLARELGSSRTAVSDELARLQELGFLRRGENLGRAKPYYLNEDFPLLPGLRSAVQYAVGAIALLREKLAGRDDIDVAFLYGSLADRPRRPESDVDLFVVGDIDGVLLSRLVREVERQTGREISLIHWSPADLVRQAQDPSSFLSAVMRQSKIFVKGGEDELRRLAGQ